MIIDVVFSSAAKHKTYAASAFLLSVILKALRAQRCHIIVAVSDWMTNTGPKMIEDMCNCYKHKEYDGLVQRDPAFAKFIHHCILYLKTTQALKKPGHVTKPDTRILGEFKQTFPSGQIDKLPKDLYGLVPAVKGFIDLSPRNTSPGITKDSLYHHATSFIMMIIEVHHLLPALAVLENSSDVNSDNFERLKNRYLVRSMVLQIIYTAMDNNDAAFYSDSLETFIQNPEIILLQRYRFTNLSRQLIPGTRSKADPRTEFAHIVQSCLESAPEYKIIAKELSNLVMKTVLDIVQGKRLPEGKPDHPVTIPPPVCIIKAKSKSKSKSVDIDKAFLVPGKLCLDSTAVLLQQAISWAQNPDTYDRTTLQGRMFMGLKLDTGDDAAYDPDQTHPIQMKNWGVHMLKKRYTAHILTSRTGLSEILTWHSTGQGMKTRHAVNHLKLPFTSLQDAIQKFSDIENLNQDRTITEGLPPMAIDNPRYYGSAANSMKLNPTLNGTSMSVQDKLTAIWSEKVQEAWEKLLGGMLGQDPESYQGKKPTWGAVLNTLSELQLDGFKDGLNKIQAVNTCAVLELVTDAEKEDLIPWLLQTDKGAWKGLQEMGFSKHPSGNAGHYRVAAFICIYNHLLNALTEDQKSSLRFSTSFLEHLLCKQHKWKLYSKNYTDVLFKISPKDSPIPLDIPEATVEESISEVQVRFSFILSSCLELTQ